MAVTQNQPDTPAGRPFVPFSRKQAARFLGHASMGATSADIGFVMNGAGAWLDHQFALPPSATLWDLLLEGKFDGIAYISGYAGIDPAVWRKLLSAPDTLRQRVTLALSEIIVAAIGDFNARWTAFSAAHYMDLLSANAFGNFRTLLQDITLSAPMGEYLTYLGSSKYNPKTGARPDENFAREIMQLFTIGLVKLRDDGTPDLLNGKPQETYTQDDIGGLARVFTGFGYDMGAETYKTPAYKRRPMICTASKHESGVKTFLGHSIPAGTDGVSSVTQALDILFAHPNVAPFIGRQLIQRLVTSNPSPAYVARVAAVFNDDGNAVKGNLKAVIEAILLDPEAVGDASLTDPTFGKIREPILRFSAWARAFNASSATGAWAIGDTSDPSRSLGQSPLRSPTVFNFFRPGYIPPGSGSAGLVAPELELTNESTVVGYVNTMQSVVKNGWKDVQPDYRRLMPLADKAQALIDLLNLELAAGQLDLATVALIKGALDSMPSGTDANRLNRIYAGLLLVFAAPEFIVQK